MIISFIFVQSNRIFYRRERKDLHTEYLITELAILVNLFFLYSSANDPVDKSHDDDDGGNRENELGDITIVGPFGSDRHAIDDDSTEKGDGETVSVKGILVENITNDEFTTRIHMG